MRLEKPKCALHVDFTVQETRRHKLCHVDMNATFYQYRKIPKRKILKKIIIPPWPTLKIDEIPFVISIDSRFLTRLWPRY